MSEQSNKSESTWKPGVEPRPSTLVHETDHGQGFVTGPYQVMQWGGQEGATVQSTSLLQKNASEVKGLDNNYKPNGYRGAAGSTPGSAH